MAVKYVRVYTDRIALALSARGGVFWDRKRDLHVHCPFCDTATVIPRDDDDEPIVAGCEHLDRDDYLTPDHDGFSVWFRACDNDEDT